MSAGEQRAFDEFFQFSAPRLAAFVVRRTALDSASVEDIVQNTLIKAVRNLAGYRGEAALFTWLTQICRHEIADAYRKTARRPGHDSLDEPEAARPSWLQLRVAERDEPAAQVDRQLRRGAVIRVLNTLPERYAYALEAKYGDGLSVKEIARALGVTVVATQSLLARARDAFQQHWRDTDDPLVRKDPT